MSNDSTGKKDYQSLKFIQRKYREILPVADVSEALVVGDVVAQKHSMSPRDIVSDHLAPYALAPNIPQLQRRFRRSYAVITLYQVR